jgi:3,4-dihydroxy 2-butanone 4-phosphate synthase/GTP cyclohydrolase II
MLDRIPHADGLSPPAALLDEMARGRMIIVAWQGASRIEGSLLIAAQFATAEAVNFMARHARGLICLALTEARAGELALPLMVPINPNRRRATFTVSIEARSGVTTGISAADRARTIAVATDPRLGGEHIVTPGHVFPLIAHPGGVLSRAERPEAAVDLARLAGLNPAAVVCDILTDDGGAAGLPGERCRACSASSS